MLVMPTVVLGLRLVKYRSTATLVILTLAGANMASCSMQTLSSSTVELKIDPSLIGIVLGTKGTRVKKIESDTGVSSIRIDSETGMYVTYSVYIK
jgi:polyribonucleotide nucleotidyltransferase